MNEYKINEIFLHADGKVYQCVRAEGTCEGCALRCGWDCPGRSCAGDERKDGIDIKYVLVTGPSDGMIYRAENGRMYRLTEGDHWNPLCSCNTAPSLGCAELDLAVFGIVLSCGWYWAPVKEDAPAPVETLRGNSKTASCYLKEVRIYERRESLTGTIMAVVKPLYDYDCD